MQVLTKEGLIDRDSLVVTNIVTEEANCRVTATEWHHQGELVRRDVWVNIYAPVSAGIEQGTT